MQTNDPAHNVVVNGYQYILADALFPRQLHAIMLLFYADNNIDKDGFIDKCFAGETASMRIHLFEKFEHRNYSIFEFIADLDAIHRVTMIKYLIENYKGFSLRDAEDYISYYNFNK